VFAGRHALKVAVEAAVAPRLSEWVRRTCEVIQADELVTGFQKTVDRQQV
jgi:hypothetical protein